MCRRRFIVTILLLTFSLLSEGQRSETAINFDWRKSHVEFEIENDVFFQSDHYYTGGLAISYTHRNLKNTPAQLILHSKSSDNYQFSGFGIQHRLYTPYDISDPYAIPFDRPYSSYVLISNFSVLINKSKNLKMSNELGIGVMGPAAMGEELQCSVHGLINSYEPIGWEGQLSNTFLIDYQFRIEKGLGNNWLFTHLIPVAEARVGTLKDEIALGLMLSFGNSTPVLASGILHEASQKDRFIWEFVFEADILGVLYDATLQGGISNSNDENALTMNEVYARQYHIRTGVNTYYKGFFLRYMIHFNSRDFENALVHHYGGIYFGFSF